jgi:cob(I)alamin adenosyltransferase
MNCLQAQKESKNKDVNTKLVYLFRLSTLFYRMSNSMQGINQSISSNLIKKIKNELFMAYYNYLSKNG